jgi:copper chaperone CopZ
MATIELSVEGLVSIKSEKEVSTILVNLNGVEDVEIDLDDGEVTIEYDDEVLGEDDIIDAIEEMGYSVIY